MTISAEQIAAARRLLGWSRAKLAALSRVGVARIARFETGSRPLSPGNLDDLKHALEGAGIVFTRGGAPGVRPKPGDANQGRRPPTA
jgi:transcriptional regulator with XRE-family HTH domain